MPRTRVRPVGELARLQREADSRRAMTFETLRERVHAVGDAYVADRRGEEGATAAYRQSLVDLASVALTLAEPIVPTRR